MLGKHLRLPSPALAVALVALVLSLSGTAMARAPIAAVARFFGLDGKQTRQVAAVADREITDKAPGLHVAYATTAGSASTATNATSATNATNAANATNATNASTATTATTATTAEGLKGVVYEEAGSVSVTAGQQSSVVIYCPAGMVVTGGGAVGSGTKSQSINISEPVEKSGTYGWSVAVSGNGNTTSTFQPVAICVPGSASGL